MGQVGCYSLDLYCDGPAHPSYPTDPANYTGRTYSECARYARRDGWVIDKRREGRECGYALCPACRRLKRPDPRPEAP